MEHKYKVWSPEKKRMYLPNPGCDILIRIDGKKFVQIDIAENSGLAPADDELIFLDYIGLKDKNRKEICRGDILRYFFPGSGPEHVYLVEWKEIRDGFAVMGVGYDWHQADTDTCEIIGNVYENPELLEAN